uniref:NR LBD domain-containing protein n=1 Tax=Mesocestoides corti TaxID=53468 RepID=A0A5K3FAR2_MESCO
MQPALLEIAILRLCEGLSTSSKPTDSVLVTKWSAKIDDAGLYNIGFADSRAFVDRLFNLAKKVQSLAPNLDEIGLMMAIILFTPDRAGLVDPLPIRWTQESWAEILRMYCETITHSQSRYAKLLRLLPTIHELSERAKKNMNIRWANMDLKRVGYINPFIGCINSFTNLLYTS